MTTYSSARVMARVHLTLTIVWALLAVPTVLWWSNSILWVGLMSVYAIVAAHWSAFQGTRAEREAEKGA